MEREKMTQKAKEVWYVYKIQIIIICVIGLLAGYFLVHLLSPREPVQLEVLFVNFYDDVSGDSAFAENFMKTAGLKKEEGKVIFDNNLFFDLSKEKDYVNSYYQKAVAYLEAKTADAVICQEENLLGIAKGGRLMDLRDERCRAIYEAYPERILMVEKDGEQIPVGIDITDSPVWKNMNGYSDSCYIGISAYTDRQDVLEKFLVYLLPET